MMKLQFTTSNADRRHLWNTEHELKVYEFLCLMITKRFMNILLVVCDFWLLSRRKQKEYAAQVLKT